MRSGDWACHKQSLSWRHRHRSNPVTASVTLCQKKVPPPPQRDRNCSSTNTERGAGRRHINLLSHGTFQRPGQVNESKPTTDVFRAWPKVVVGSALSELPSPRRGDGGPQGRMRGAKPHQTAWPDGQEALKAWQGKQCSTDAIPPPHPPFGHLLPKGRREMQAGEGTTEIGGKYGVKATTGRAAYPFSAQEEPIDADGTAC